MYIFETTKTIPSKTCPGVELTFNKMTEDRRIALMKAIAEPNKKVRMLLDKIDEARQGGSGNAVATLCLDDELQMVITQELNPAKIKWALAGVKNLYIGNDKVQGSLDNIMAWPSPLIREVLEIADDGSVLEDNVAKNSESPSTSGSQD